MIEIEEKLAGINGLVNENEMLNIRAAMQNPQRVLCPFNKRYVNLPIFCVGYQYICTAWSQPSCAPRLPGCRRKTHKYFPPRPVRRVPVDRDPCGRFDPLQL